MKKRIVSILLAVVMIIGMLPLGTIPAFAADTVTEYYALDVSAPDSSEGAYIDTGFFPTSSTRVVMDAVVTMDGGWANLFGVYREDNYFYVNNALGHFGAGFGSTIDWVTPFAFARRKIELDRNVFKLDGEIKYTFPSAAFTCSDPMYLFALNHYGNIQFQGGQHIRFYSCQIYNNGNMVFDFVPAGKGGTYGLYDKKSGAFYEFNDDSYVTAVNGPDKKTALPTTPGSTLTSGTYVVSNNTTIEAANGQSALIVSGFVTIIIEKGVTLTVKGGNAVGTKGAGAGIEVPDGSALTVAGGGILKATGGNASKGANGENGADAIVYDVDETNNPHFDDDDWGYTGAGGNGGNGGGGAGAGIGGKGGSGGEGGKGGAGVNMELEAWTYLSGLNGESGKFGTAGEGCGNVSIYDSVTRNISGGKADANHSSGGAVGYSRIFIGTYLDYPVFGGGGGGGGGNGYPAANIGSGGAGGGGGGGGGSGCMANYFEDAARAARANGYGGKGGVGSGGAGGEGSHGDDYNLDIAVYPGGGGFGGESGGAGTEKANIIPTVQIPTPNTLVYNGKEQEGVTFPFGNITGNKATNAGEYTAFLTPYDGYYWKDGSTGEKTVNWSIARCPVSPKPRTDLVYNGNEQQGIDFPQGSITGNKATNAGEHTAMLTPSANYCWEDGTYGEKTISWSIAKCPVSTPAKTSFCYTGDEIVIKETDLYTVENGKATAIDDYTATLKLKDAQNYKWENSNDSSIAVNYDIHEFKDNGSGKCKHCGGTVTYYYGDYPYLERTVTDDNKVKTEEKTRIAVDYIAADDAVWGVKDETVWYIVDSDITLTGRPEVKGNVNIILKNGTTLTANHGINVEKGNTLNLYAQSDNEDIMGKLTTATGGVTAIGGTSPIFDQLNGGNAGTVNFYGGNISLNTSGTACVGGGNGSNAGDGTGVGGNSGNISFYGGNISLKASGAPCIGGGNGGNSGSKAYGGARGGNAEIINFYGGNISLDASGAPCIGGGNGGNGQMALNDGHDQEGTNGGSGGNGGTVSFYGGSISLVGSGSPCIGGGRGGNGGDSFVGREKAGGGGKGGVSGKVYFIAGDIIMSNTDTDCIGGGKGGNGGATDDYYYYGPFGADGEFEDGYWNVSGEPGIKAGNNEQDAEDITEYNGQAYLSVHYHTWKWLDGTYHECSVCDETEEHIDEDDDSYCDQCGHLLCDHINRTVTSHLWNSDHTSCTLYWHCDDCNEDYQSVATEIKLVEDTHGADCKTMGTGHYEAIFDGFDTIKTRENGFDTKYGDHNYINYVCERCDDELLEEAKQDAKKAINNTVDNSTDVAVLLLKDTAETIVDGASHVKDVLDAWDYWLTAINKQLGGSSTHTHTFADTYTHNDTHHWRICTCEDEKCKNLVDGFAVHTFDEGVVDGNKTTYTCKCGYIKVVYDKPDDEGEIVTGISYTGISLTLGSDISINFYMELSDDARQNSTMTFNIGGRIVTGIKARENENGYYFSTPLTALEMAETVTATFTYNGIDYVQEYSVADYIEEIVGNENIYGKEAAALAKKIANYGHYAQIYLASIHSNVTIGKDGYEEMDKFVGVDIDVENAKEALKNYKVSVSGTSDNLSLYGSTVYFDSATALNYYVTVKNGEEPTAKATNTVTGEEKQVEIKLYKGNIYIVSVKDIMATELADDIKVTINDEITLTGSVFAYCNSVVSAHSFDGATEKDTFAVNAMAAFYEYYKAAVDYANRKIFKDGYLYFTCDAPDVKKVSMSLYGIDDKIELTDIGDGIYSDDGYLFDKIGYANGHVTFTVIDESSMTNMPYLDVPFDEADCAPMIVKITGFTDENYGCEIKKLK